MTMIHDFPTVSRAFIDDWLEALRRCSTELQLSSFLDAAGLSATGDGLASRVTLDQMVTLYQIAATRTEDEMMGLWSRPIRARALQHLCTTVREASTLPAALHRFRTFWNLLLDDYRLELRAEGETVRLALEPRGAAPVQRFGHMLILKLSHGLASWLAGAETRLRHVAFAFKEPDFAEDYPVLFPAPVQFNASCSEICFEAAELGPCVARSDAELREFLLRAPRDWLFTQYREHTLPLRVRAFLRQTDWMKCRLTDAAGALRMTPRTLIRRLEADGASFQAIKDNLRRDLAIRSLEEGRKTIEAISQDIGFSATTNFYRAFRRWTGATPGSYRRRPQ